MAYTKRLQKVSTDVVGVADNFEAVGDVVHEPVALTQVVAQWVTQVVLGSQLSQGGHDACKSKSLKQ